MTMNTTLDSKIDFVQWFEYEKLLNENLQLKLKIEELNDKTIDQDKWIALLES